MGTQQTAGQRPRCLVLDCAKRRARPAHQDAASWFVGALKDVASVPTAAMRGRDLCWARSGLRAAGQHAGGRVVRGVCQCVQGQGGRADERKRCDAARGGACGRRARRQLLLGRDRVRQRGAARARKAHE